MAQNSSPRRRLAPKFVATTTYHLGSRASLTLARDDATVSNRREVSPLALERMRHFLMPRSADVSASMNAGRENSRSAYFISGAAGLGSPMP